MCPKGHTITPKLKFCPRCCQKCSIKFNLILSNVWCQIVRCQIVLVPNCLGAKLSAFIILEPKFPLYYLGAKLSGPVPNCSVPNCPTILGSTKTRKKRKFHYELFASEKLVKKNTQKWLKFVGHRYSLFLCSLAVEIYDHHN